MNATAVVALVENDNGKVITCQTLDMLIRGNGVANVDPRMYMFNSKKLKKTRTNIHFVA